MDISDYIDYNKLWEDLKIKIQEIENKHLYEIASNEEVFDRIKLVISGCIPIDLHECWYDPDDEYMCLCFTCVLGSIGFQYDFNMDRFENYTIISGEINNEAIN